MTEKISRLLIDHALPEDEARKVHNLQEALLLIYQQFFPAKEIVPQELVLEIVEEELIERLIGQNVLIITDIAYLIELFDLDDDFLRYVNDRGRDLLKDKLRKCYFDYWSFVKRDDGSKYTEPLKRRRKKLE